MTQHAASVDFAKMQEIFLAAVERQRPEECEAYLDQACADDGELRRQVNLLLNAHREAGSVPGAASQNGDEAGTHEVVAERPGTVIGPYKLLEQIGEGGMGTVWMAQQEVPVKRVVAVKLIKAGMDSKQVLARFEAERQALALMDHPNIAKVLDVGATSRPYFVMDLVKGVPITKYCDDHQLTPRQRLELFVPVCQAIQHAHQKGIIHRDIKPSNVLVAMFDDKPAPKVIDFGVAKATGDPLTEETLHTGFGVVVGTVEYMSPEQASLNEVDVDTRSDIYSLGVLLYELLTGTTPLERKRVEKSGMLEALRVIREEDTPTLSHRLATTVELPAIAAKRGLEPRRLTKLVRGELNWIAMKALEKDRNRRYETANGFATDVQRYLNDEPVQACPPSAAYWFRKFISRNKGRVVAATALAVAIIVGVVAVWMAEAGASRLRVTAETDRATRESRADASVAAAIREARGHIDVAWTASDYPDRMQLATDSASAALRRAEDIAPSGPPTEEVSADLAALRNDVGELARHTTLINAAENNRLRYLDENNDQNFLQAKATLFRRHLKELQRFGLDLTKYGSVEEMARTVADSRIRDSLLGILLEAHEHAPDSRSGPGSPGPKDRLWQLIRSARQLCGGNYARWQDLLDRNDNWGLAVFAASKDALSFRSTLLGAMGRHFFDVRDYTTCRVLLRAAVDRYPHDVWLHYYLSAVCTWVEPPDYSEALRHASAASALRPMNAGLHVQVARTYSHLRAFDQALDACRKSLELSPESASAQLQLAFVMQGKKNAEGAIAAFRESIRIDPNNARAHQQLLSTLKGENRHTETVQATLAAWRAVPGYVEHPTNKVLYDGAVAAMRCVQGQGVNPPPAAERPAYRKHALDFLTADLDLIRKLPENELAFVYESVLRWHREPYFSSVRDPMIEQLPPEEREGWKKLWAGVRGLRDLFGKKSGSPKTETKPDAKPDRN